MITIRILGILEPLALYPGEEKMRISPLQKKVLSVIKKLVPIGLILVSLIACSNENATCTQTSTPDEIHMMVFKVLLKYISVAINYAPSTTNQTTNLCSLSSNPPSMLRATSPMSSKAAQVYANQFHQLAMKAINVVVLYLESSSPNVISQVFEEIAMVPSLDSAFWLKLESLTTATSSKVLGAGMMMKYVSYPSLLWRTAVEAFTRAVTHALPIVVRASSTNHSA